ncbi:MAG: MMPL family transporter, partial [Candidatus Sericytochromatia bacterium]
MQRTFHRLGGWVHRHRLWVILTWVVLVGFGGWGASKLPAALFGGSGAIPGSASERVSHVLRDEFDNPFAHLLLVTLESETEVIEAERVQRAAEVLRAMPEVRRVVTARELPGDRLRSPDGRRTVLMVGLNARTTEEEEQAVPVLRDALAPIRAEIISTDPSGTLAVTGHSALTYDVNAYNKRDGEVAEARALPLTLLILLIAFG